MPLDVDSNQPAPHFGTSGLRGVVESFTPSTISAYIGAFLELQDFVGEKKEVFVGADLRLSSPVIAAHVFAAARNLGWTAVNGGNVPTPALAAYAMARGCPAIIVTGSHVPDTHNGIKFYRRDGEFLKADEGPVRKRADQLLVSNFCAEPPEVPEIEVNIARAYVSRYTSAFPSTALQGLKIGIDQHSAVGRDLIVETLETLGAKCFPFRRSNDFIAVDTEALACDDKERAIEQLKKHKLDAIVSTDGDGDRPLMIDEHGTQINGDVLGALTAKSLKIETVATPLTSTSAIEQSGWFEKVIRTRIGSPYVVEAMAEHTDTADSVAGFEANGGFLLGTDIELPGGRLQALPTRDALLPLIVVLAEANSLSMPVSVLAGTLPNRFMRADRIKKVTNDLAQKFLREIVSSRVLRFEVDKRLAAPININTTDGARMTFADTSIVHFRQSGNAPEMRIYVETSEPDLTERMLSEIRHGLGAFLEKRK